TDEDTDRIALCSVHREEEGQSPPVPSASRGSAVGSDHQSTFGDAVFGETATARALPPADSSDFDEEPSIVVDSGQLGIRNHPEPVQPALSAAAAPSTPAPGPTAVQAPPRAVGPVDSWQANAVVMGAQAKDDTRTELLPTFQRKTSWRLTGLLAAITALVGLGSGYLLWGMGSSQKATDGAPEHLAAAADTPADSAADDDQRGQSAAARQVAPRTSPKNTRSNRRGDKYTKRNTKSAPSERSSRSKDCNVRIGSVPRGAEVFAGNKPLGKTPLTARLPCGKTALRFERPRYRTEIKKLDLANNLRNAVTAKLQRPEVRLRITSTPPGARVSVGGKTIGQTPLSHSASGFVNLDLVISKDGYRTYRKRLSPRPPKMNVDAKLVPRRGK
ncbi:MAG: PEGA domain-containing protein, partial [Myxococcota bacterium]